MNFSLYGFSVWVLPLIFAITFHEAAHGFVAHRLGDDTAFNLGRVSFNPIRHIDPFGTIILPGMLLLSHAPFLFGYAKPVPVRFGALRDPRIGKRRTRVADQLCQLFSRNISHRRRNWRAASTGGRKSAPK